MNRITRDYCSRNHHPKGWKAWTCRYSEPPGPRAYCVNCGAEISLINISAWPHPERRGNTVMHTRFTSIGRRRIFVYEIPKWPG